jgi:hypothetical protein
MKMPLAGGPPAILANNQPNAGSIVLDSTNLYWPSPSDGSIMKMPLGGGAPTAMATGQNDPRRVAVDATSIHWTNGGTEANNYADGAVMKLSLQGGSPTMLASGQRRSHGHCGGWHQRLLDDLDRKRQPHEGRLQRRNTRGARDPLGRSHSPSPGGGCRTCLLDHQRRGEQDAGQRGRHSGSRLKRLPCLGVRALHDDASVARTSIIKCGMPTTATARPVVGRSDIFESLHRNAECLMTESCIDKAPYAWAVFSSRLSMDRYRTTPEKIRQFADTTTKVLAGRFACSEDRVRPTAWLACVSLAHVGRALVHHPPPTRRREADRGHRPHGARLVDGYRVVAVGHEPIVFASVSRFARFEAFPIGQ